MGYSSPNPPVACVIADLKGNILSEGATRLAGENHAEREAYLKLGEKYTIPHILYVTLEPCSHFGRTPPCLDLILEKKPVRAVIGIPDPNPLVRARDGLKELKNSGIEAVFSSEIAEISKTFLSGFISRIERKRPRIFIKTALSSEGFFTSQDKTRMQISNESSNSAVQLLRSRMDAVLVGPGTVCRDAPSLNFRSAGLKTVKVDSHINDVFWSSLFEFSQAGKWSFLNSGAEFYQPWRVFIVSSELFPDQAFFEKQKQINTETGSRKCLFFTLGNMDAERLEQMENVSAHAGCIQMKRFDGLLENLAERGISNLLAEGGNYVYKNISNLLEPEDQIIKIRTDFRIQGGISPEISKETASEFFSFDVGSDHWEIRKIR